MRIDPASLSPNAVYYTLISTLLPRPIAWISTRGPDGGRNLAPFSFFAGVVGRPPTLSVAIGRRGPSTPKDTARNILERKDFVVNVVPFALAEAMVATSAEVAFGVDEVALAGLTTVPADGVAADRVVGSPVQYECTLFQHVPIADGDEVTADLIIGRIVAIHVDDAVLDGRGRVDEALLDAVGRMGGAGYCRTRDRFELKRPG
ncbi:MAG: flavin reductase family protein [bacterium]